MLYPVSKDIGDPLLYPLMADGFLGNEPRALLCLWNRSQVTAWLGTRQGIGNASDQHLGHGVENPMKIYREKALEPIRP
jgi:hypothetical protein